MEALLGGTDRPFTTADALAAGLTQHRLKRLRDAGHIRTVLRGVHVPSTTPDTIETRAQAARLVLDPSTVVVDRLAAWLWGIDTYRYFELQALPRLDVVAVPGTHRTRRRECVRRSRALSAGDLTHQQGLLLTTPARTAVDLACQLHAREGLAQLDWFMRAQAVSREDLTRQVDSLLGRRGVVQARRLVAMGDARSESPRESWLRYEILARGLAAPTPQHWVMVGQRLLWRLDLAWPHLRVAIEYDGFDFHTGGLDVRRDLTRRSWLESHGWTVLVVGPGDFDPAAVDAWTRALSDALDLARQPGSWRSRVRG